MNFYNFDHPVFRLLFVFVLIFDATLKMMSLYRAGGKKQKVWFVVLFLVNSIGILPLIYLLWGEKINEITHPLQIKTLKIIKQISKR